MYFHKQLLLFHYYILVGFNHLRQKKGLFMYRVPKLKIRGVCGRTLTTQPYTGGKCTFFQNVRFPLVEGHVSVRSNSNGPIRVEGEATLRAAVVASLYTSI